MNAREGIAAPQKLIRLYDLLVGDEDARVCKDIPESAILALALLSLLGARQAGRLADVQ